MNAVSAVARMMFGRAAKDKVIAVLGAFFDDSGTHAGSRAVVIGGLLGTDGQWDAFEAAWEARLASPLPGKPPLEIFHLTDCRNRVGEFQNYNDGEIDRITYLFRRIIVDLGFVTIAVAVNGAAWDELVVGEIASEFPSALEWCFSKCIEATVDNIRLRKPGESVFIFFDQGIKSGLERWVALYRLQSEKYSEIDGVAFAPVRKVVALQGADTIATETYQFCLEWMKNQASPIVNPHFREFLTRELSVGLLLDREQISEMLTLFKASRAKRGAV